MKVLETERLTLRWLSIDDADFILELVNDPAWLKYIGDKGVRSLEDARNYILKGPIDMYARHGFGLYLAELKDGTVPIGVCGLTTREPLREVEIAFAFLPRFWAKGYAYESASAVMAYAKDVLVKDRIVAIATPDNHRSAKLLEKLGLRFERMIKLSSDAQELKLFVAHDMP